MIPLRNCSQMAEGDVGSGNAGLFFPFKLSFFLAKYVGRLEHKDFSTNSHRVAAASLQFSALHTWARKVSFSDSFLDPVKE